MTRRMFSDSITTSDAFLDMPAESQLLYFHLGMNADDDGFIANTKMTQRIIGAGDDSIKILFMKKFLLMLDNGVCVVKHWRINNYIRKDIYRETRYLEQKKKLFIRPNGAYSLNSEQAIALPSGHFTLQNKFGKDVENEPQDSTSTLRARDVHLGKVRKGKERIDKNIYTSEFEDFWKAYPKKNGKKASMEQWKKLTTDDRSAIMVDIPLRHNSKKWIGGYIKDPERYLKHRQWEDEIEDQQLPVLDSQMYAKSENKG